LRVIRPSLANSTAILSAAFAVRSPKRVCSNMFFEKDRIRAVREMILVDDVKSRRAVLAKLLPMQRADFVELFEIMQGLPVTIRLLDPP
jgi:phosphoenolpyruvate synthase/pyruvate phosphate dikinase